jgi:hydrogenase-1 operon protein HyaF
MKDFPIPVRAVPADIGPGSQPAEDAELAVLDMPRDMARFEMPRVPEQLPPAVLLAARDLLARWLADLQAWDPQQPPGPQVDLAGTEAPVLAVLNQLLGEGEVAIRLAGTPELHIQESVFSGLWRCAQVGAQGEVQRDWLEAGPVPAEALARARAAAQQQLAAVDLPAGAMNSPALLAEIASRRCDVQPGAAAGVINLTLLPMSPDDHQVLAQALPVGPLAMISRGFGNCHVTSTLTRDVWRVQYFNSMQTLILNTLEIVHLPEAAIAAPEDLVDSRERLAELVQWLGEATGDGSAMAPAP